MEFGVCFALLPLGALQKGDGKGRHRAHHDPVHTEPEQFEEHGGIGGRPAGGRGRDGDRNVGGGDEEREV
ncbi:hypothetical protein BC938DRAFT_476140 [Jimgerdemannia flammicorona]|uniref:Uncharacterized protein n=1 Tax=Jimgerdemannia flammicorona TaxID=994334 RepID=A0A433PK79_9FUNG|nr:hypothetical protein BC938DRAFT_476140 [Jimgerdemannia flammicorona]